MIYGKIQGHFHRAIFAVASLLGNLLPSNTKSTGPNEDILPYPKTLPDGSVWPKISIVVPTLNQGRFIEETLQSIVSQNYPDVELIVIDGGSTDATHEIVSRFKQSIHAYLSEPDRGQSDAINKGFRLASGSILTWLNSDDQLAPGALHSIAFAFATHKTDMVSGICEIYKAGKLIDRHIASCGDGPLKIEELLDLDGRWNEGRFFYQPEVFFTREIWERAGGQVHEDLYYSMDYELWCRFALAGAKLHTIGSAVAKFRMHADQKTTDPNKFRAELKIVRAKFVAMLASSQLALPNQKLPRKKKPKIVMINDWGNRYGAGIAHNRIRSALRLAQYKVYFLAIASRVGGGRKINEARFAAKVLALKPDLIIYGNLHGAVKDSVLIPKMLAGIKSLWITHDFWLFTGRCAYFGDCRKFKTGCDASCPTASEYPSLPPEKISGAWHDKRELLASDGAPVIVAFSDWALATAKSMMGDGLVADREFGKFKPGLPVGDFRPLQKSAVREFFGISPDSFVVAFTVTALSETRKGGRYVVEALAGLGLPDITVVLIGNNDVGFAIDGVKVVSTGYLRKAHLVNRALNAADVFVGPSLAETFGLVFQEAAFAGVPSIGFDGTGVSEAIVDGVTGFLVEQSADALRQMILKLYSDRALCREMGQRAHLYARNEFSVESMNLSFHSMLENLNMTTDLGIANKISFK
ncbi:MAG: glycosyltransferase [Aestuariivirga sp.]